MLHGLLVLDKPSGCSSHDLVTWARRLLGQKRIGHTGTLDPLATGVLVLCLGAATRVAEYLTGQDKAYRSELLLGYHSDTYDRDGTWQEHEEFTLGLEALQGALHSFRGDIIQVPPAYSAIQVDGQRLYQLARKGVIVTPPPRRVTISSLELLEAPVELQRGSLVTLQVSCSKGTYIRSLAHDLGATLGCGALLHGLRRTASGNISLDDAWSLADAEAMVQEGRTKELLYPLTPQCMGLPWLLLDHEGADHVSKGRVLPQERISNPLPWPVETSPMLLLTPQGISAIGVFDAVAKVIRPRKVLNEPVPVQLQPRTDDL